MAIAKTLYGPDLIRVVRKKSQVKKLNDLETVIRQVVVGQSVATLGVFTARRVEEGIVLLYRPKVEQENSFRLDTQLLLGCLGVGKLGEVSKRWGISEYTIKARLKGKV